MTNLILGDSYLILKTLAADSVDAVVTDPPYGLSFMNKHWDHDVPSVELWREVFRVLKPGGHVLSFGGTRTYHRMVVNIEDAGFEIRDQIQWLYGSGFPKSHDVSKGIDKAAGAEREVVGENPNNRDCSKHNYNSVGNVGSKAVLTAAATDLAKQWQGWGTALKPANEPIVLARKPLIGTVAENVQAFGTGALNIDASRIGTQDMSVEFDRTWNENSGELGKRYAQGSRVSGKTVPPGRWPANVLFDEEAAAVLDEQSGTLKSGQPGKRTKEWTGYATGLGKLEQESGYGDSGGASRFFYVAKASKRERNAGLGDLPLREAGIKNDSGRGFSESDPNKKIMMQNHHPTVKPIKLMEYLVRLITPPGGTVLDPFMGSGTTGIAAKNLGFGFVGIERSEEYFEIAKRRI